MSERGASILRDHNAAPAPAAAESPSAGFSIPSRDVALDGWDDAVHGRVRWRTLISADRTPSSGFVLGIAEMDADGSLGLHRHAPPEFYLGLSGAGTVTIDGQRHAIDSGAAIYIPGGAEHGVVAGAQGLVFAYGFGVDDFSAISYLFSAEANGSPR